MASSRPRQISLALTGPTAEKRDVCGAHPGRRVARAGRQRVCGPGRGGVRPVQGRGEPQWTKDANSDHAKLLRPREQAIAQLKNWRVLRKLRCCPQRAEETARTVLFFQLREARG